ncbi:MAG TPA: hypothetical protein PLD20_20835, partial [Blastocatellia bacterium]|nr:hypothetical protein [Blastocatellia bacterium]
TVFTFKFSIIVSPTFPSDEIAVGDGNGFDANFAPVVSLRVQILDVVLVSVKRGKIGIAEKEGEPVNAQVHRLDYRLSGKCCGGNTLMALDACRINVAVA